jgi:hypothetical protein
MLESVYLIPDYWLEGSFHPEGPASGQLDQGFPVVFLGPRANYVEFHFALNASHAALPVVTSKFFPNIALPILNQNFPQCRPSNVGTKINSHHTQ